MEDGKDKTIHKHLKTNGTENKWRQKRMHGEFMYVYREITGGNKLYL